MKEKVLYIGLVFNTLLTITGIVVLLLILL